MTWPPAELPIDFQNATPQENTHPDAHNATNQTINADLVPEIIRVGELAETIGLYLPLTGGTLTGDLQVNGSTQSWSFRTGNGNLSAPSYSFYNDLSTGLFRQAEGVLGVAGNMRAFGDLQVDGNSDLKINVPADFWSGISGTVFTQHGMVGGSQGAYAMSMTANGYRNTSNKWTSMGVNGSTGAVQIDLATTGNFHVRVASNHPTGSSSSPPIRFTVTDTKTTVYQDLQVDGQTLAQNGTKAAPGYSFASDPDTGIYLYSAGITSITCAGKNIANFGLDGVSFPEGLAEITGTAANLHIGDNGQIRRITDVAKSPTTADVSRLETVIETLTARIEELEARLKPAATDV